MDWNEDAIAQLKALWAEGHTATEIGRRLGCSKSAVIGKADRLDLPDRKVASTQGASRSGPGEQELAVSLLILVAQDAVEPRYMGSNANPDHIQDEAVRFCFDQTGPWAQSREIWCDLAGVDPGVYVSGVRLAKLEQRGVLFAAQHLRSSRHGGARLDV